MLQSYRKFLDEGPSSAFRWTVIGGTPIIILIIGLYFGAFHENPAIVYQDLPYATDKEVYQQGERISLEGVSFCRYTAQPFELVLEFRNDIILFVPSQHRAGFSKGCVSDITFSLLDVPEHLVPGTYSIHAKAIYQVNPIARRIGEWYTTPFEVVAND